MLRKMTALGLAVCLLYGAVAAAQEDIPRGPCGSKPVAPPQFRKGGEGVPPLPLPATPLRRTERKRPPSPPVLIAKIQFGSQKELKVSDGVLRYFDWNKDPADIPNLLNDAADRALNIHYTWKCGPLDAFTTDPAQYPIYYYTGSDDFTLSDAEVARLREYVRAGGVIWGDTALGDPDFFKAFVREMSKVLPDRSFHRLDADHPLFNCYYPIKQVVVHAAGARRAQRRADVLRRGPRRAHGDHALALRPELRLGRAQARGRVQRGPERRAQARRQHDRLRAGDVPDLDLPEHRQDLLPGGRAPARRVRPRAGEDRRELGFAVQRDRQPAQGHRDEDQRRDQVRPQSRGPRQERPGELPVPLHHRRVRFHAERRGEAGAEDATWPRAASSWRALRAGRRNSTARSAARSPTCCRAIRSSACRRSIRCTAS